MSSGFAPVVKASAVYRTLWRWHFYAGLFCIPFILTLAISGAIYLFKPQLDALVDRPYQQLAVAGERSSANAQIAAALKAFPGSHFVNYQLPQRESDAVVITLLNQGMQRLVYINPYTLEPLHSINVDDQFVQQVRTFHGELLAGNPGSILVELAGCWAIVLILTGLYLWWPRNSRGLAGVLYPRLRQGQRTFWRDLHAVTGIWLSAFALFLLVSGLPWTLVWGTAFKELRQWGDTPVQQDWTLSRAQEHHHSAGATDHSVDLSEALLQGAVALQLAPPVLLLPSRENPAVWKVQSQHQNRPLRANAWLEQSSGQVVRSESFAQRPLLDRVIGIGVAAHEGQLFGWFNQLLGVLTALGLVLMSLTGLVLWQRRRPTAGLGAPVPMADTRAGRVVGGVILLCALLLPVLAGSLLVLWLAEMLLLKRYPPVRHWLGLAPR
ncbi:PepSY-associated TM helix domain-containing protein [Porticoccus sp.]